MSKKSKQFAVIALDMVFLVLSLVWLVGDLRDNNSLLWALLDGGLVGLWVWLLHRDIARLNAPLSGTPEVIAITAETTRADLLKRGVEPVETPFDFDPAKGHKNPIEDCPACRDRLKGSE